RAIEKRPMKIGEWFACSATPPYIRVYKMAARIHSSDFFASEPPSSLLNKILKKKPSFFKSYSERVRSAAAATVRRGNPPCVTGYRHPHSSEPHRGAEPRSSLGGPGGTKSANFYTVVESIPPGCLSDRVLLGAVVSSHLMTGMIAASCA
ncbi:MAG: hypothetical protein ACRC0L_12810, partial [Angustibacter sp.]